MKIAVMQPTYLPWLGYFNLILNSDVFVFLDDVQFERKSWQQRNRVINLNKLTWLTIPVLSTGELNQKIMDVKIDNSQPWKNYHRKSIEHCCNSAPYMGEISKLLDIYRNNFDNLRDFNICLIRQILNTLHIERKLIVSSELNISGRRSDRLLAICQKLGASEYLSPRGSREYIEADGVFAREGFPVEFQNYNPPIYRDTPPLHAGEFPSILDAIAYIGPCKTRELVARAAS